MIELIDVTKIFNQGAVNEFRAVRGVSLRLATGRVTCLQGPSGSGKTTLLSIIGCLSRPTSGRILVNGERISGLPERFLAEVRRRTFGFVFQRFNLIKGLTVLENVVLPAYPAGLPYKTLIDAGERLLRQFDLISKKRLRVEFLSGGEAQRVAICRALINNPAILIADEPTANLDSHLSAELMVLIAGLQRAGKTILISSHDPLVVESSVVDRVITMRDGTIVE